MTSLKKSGEPQLTEENFQDAALVFQDRQAGVSVVYDPDLKKYFYNAYCIEATLLKELFSCEYEFLEDALNVINSEFSTWSLKKLEEKKSGCGSCAAK